MKELKDLYFPDECKYGSQHVWVKPDGEFLKIGISDFAQDQLGQIVFIELPEAGSQIERGKEFGNVESVKAVNGLFAPVSGEVVEVNSLLEDEPEKINQSPYEDGWILRIKPHNRDYGQDLLSADQYKASLGK